MSAEPATTRHPHIVETADGSKTLFCPHYQQTYHSIHGALNESRHVFIQASELALRLRTTQKLRLLEIGFGTGLNYLLATQLAEETGAYLHYTALEQSILPRSLLAQLDYGALLNRATHTQKLLAHLDNCYRITDELLPVFAYNNTYLQLHRKIDLLLTDNTPHFDLVFLDAFSPGKNAELWSVELINLLYSHLNDGGAVVTYCAKGAVRRAMLQCGFCVTRLPGPPGKREMLVAKR